MNDTQTDALRASTENYGAVPKYSRGEEIANMVTHIVGAVFAFSSLVLCVAFAAWHRNLAALISGVVYGISMITVYVISSIYHGLDPKSSLKGKRVMRIIDHCDIYGLIVGTFTPIALTVLRSQNPVLAYASLSIVIVTSAVGLTFTAIGIKKYKIISYGSYFVSGWSVMITMFSLYKACGLEFILLLFFGGAVYTSGMIFYYLETNHKKYCHSIFHIFILGGSVIQFFAILKYCM